MDYELEIKDIKSTLERHTEELAIHDKAIIALSDSVKTDAQRMQILEVKLDNMESNQKSMKSDMKNMQSNIEAIRNQNTLTATSLKTIKRWLKVIAGVLVVVVISIFIAGGEFKASLIKGIVQVLPAVVS